MKNLRCIVLQLFVVGLLLVASCSEKIAPASTPQTGSSEKLIKKLNILSWNIYMLPPLIYAETGKLKRAKVIGDILAKSDYDVIVFQEAFHTSARSILVEKLENKYPYR